MNSVARLSIELPEKWPACRRCNPSLLNIRMSVKGCYCHFIMTILTLLAGMTEAESARLDFFSYLTRELGKSILGSKGMVLMHPSVSVSRST